MKKLAVMLALAITLASCSSRGSKNEDDTGGRFIKIYVDFTNTILVDSETGVMYYWYYGGYSGGLTVMVDKNGQPLLWEGSVAE